MLGIFDVVTVRLPIATIFDDLIKLPTVSQLSVLKKSKLI